MAFKTASASTVADSEGETEQCLDLRRDSTPRRARSNGDEDRPRAPWTSRSRALTASAPLLEGPACPSPGHRVNAIVMVVVHVCSDQPVEMPFVQRDDLVEQLAPAAAHPALSDAVLPGGLNGRARRVQTCGFQEPDDIAVKRRVVVKQHEAMRTIARKYIPQLLHDPRGCRLASHTRVGRATTAG